MSNTHETDMDIQEFLVQIAADVAETKTTALLVKDEIAEVKEYQKAQNGRVFQLAEHVNSNFKRIDIDQAKREEQVKVNAKWQAWLASFLGGLVVLVGRSLVDLLLHGK